MYIISHCETVYEKSTVYDFKISNFFEKHTQWFTVYYFKLVGLILIHSLLNFRPKSPMPCSFWRVVQGYLWILIAPKGPLLENSDCKGFRTEWSTLGRLYKSFLGPPKSSRVSLCLLVSDLNFFFAKHVSRLLKMRHLKCGTVIFQKNFRTQFTLFVKITQIDHPRDASTFSD